MSSNALVRARLWLPHGNTLSDVAFRTRHRFLRWLLLAHVPVLLVWAWALDIPLGHAAVELSPALVAWVLSGVVSNRRAAAVLCTAGLTWCSLVLIHITGGSVEAHVHLFIIIPFIVLYQDWIPFLYTVAFTVLGDGLGRWMGADLLFDHTDAAHRPWTWAAVNGAAVAMAGGGTVLFWRSSEREQALTTAYAAELATQQEHASSRDAGHRTFSDLLVTLARRNQNLIERQLRLIGTLEQEEPDDRVRSNLLRLDHFATRMRRNAESLIVLSGAETAPRLNDAQPLSEVLRAAVGEIEDQDRVDVAVQADPLLAGRAVANLAHLLAELIENASLFSPTTSRVSVVGRSLRERGCEVAVVDSGIGMSDADLAAANERLAAPTEVDVELVRMLGLHVVGRLALRLGVAVHLERNSLGGMTATVTIPPALTSDGSVPARPAPAVVTVPRLAAVVGAPSDTRTSRPAVATLDPRPATIPHLAIVASNPRAGTGLGLPRLAYGAGSPRRTPAPQTAWDLGGDPVPTRRPAAPRPAAAPPAPTRAATTPAATTPAAPMAPTGYPPATPVSGNGQAGRPPLVRRVPMASLDLIERGDATPAAPPLPPDARRLSSFQTGVRRARSGDDDATDEPR